MRCLPGLLIAGLLMSTTHGATFVYVSKTQENEIQIYRLDEETGALEPTATLPVAGTPGCLSIDAARQYLFASLRSTGVIAAHKIDPVNGNLLPLSRSTIDPAANATYLKPDLTGHWLLSASYTGGTVLVHGISDGIVSEAVLQKIVTARTAHCVAIDRTNTWVLVPHVAPNAVYQFRFDAVAGVLEPAPPAPGGAPGAGPRHIAWHPKLNVAYTSNETGSSITAYVFDPATGLTPAQTLSTLPSDFVAKNTTAEVKVHPTGRFVWVSNRGHDSLACFGIDATGKLAALGHTPTEPTPRSFDIDPSGKYVFSAGEASGRLAVYTIDQSTGKLDRKYSYDVGKSLSWVLAVEVGAP